jgi:hypothetical protein
LGNFDARYTIWVRPDTRDCPSVRLGWSSIPALTDPHVYELEELGVIPHPWQFLRSSETRSLRSRLCVVARNAFDRLRFLWS